MKEWYRDDPGLYFEALGLLQEWACNAARSYSMKQVVSGMICLWTISHMQKMMVCGSTIRRIWRREIQNHRDDCLIEKDGAVYYTIMHTEKG
jgi:hypothetical protein